jgi:hypothetical protein
MRRIICFILISQTLVIGCAETNTQRAQRLGPMLTEAGFHMVPANTPARLQRLKDMTPLKMSYVSRNGKVFYWFPDPYVCDCIYVGNQREYLAYEQLKQENAEQAQPSDEQAYEQFMASPAGQVFYGD